jgi:hypothetical protein
LAGQIIGVSLPKDSIGKVLSDDGLWILLWVTEKPKIGKRWKEARS